MNLLLIQLRRIGDVMMTTPAVRALRKAFPEASISFLTESPSDQVYKNNPHLDQLLLYPKNNYCLLYTSPSPRDTLLSRMPSSA